MSDKHIDMGLEHKFARLEEAVHTEDGVAIEGIEHGGHLFTIHGRSLWWCLPAVAWQ